MAVAVVISGSSRRGCNLRVLCDNNGSRRDRHSGVDGGRGFVSHTGICATGSAAVLAPIFSAGSITIEKEQRTLASLLTSLLTSGQIWWGKFVASLLFVFLLLVTSLPVLSMAFAFGGIGPWEIFSATLTTVIILACMSAIGLYCSSAFQRSVHATAVSYATVIAISVVTAIVFFRALYHVRIRTSLPAGCQWKRLVRHPAGYPGSPCT